MIALQSLGSTARSSSANAASRSPRSAWAAMMPSDGHVLRRRGAPSASRGGGARRRDGRRARTHTPRSRPASREVFANHVGKSGTAFAKSRLDRVHPGEVGARDVERRVERNVASSSRSASSYRPRNRRASSRTRALIVSDTGSSARARCNDASACSWCPVSACEPAAEEVRARVVRVQRLGAVEFTRGARPSPSRRKGDHAERGVRLGERAVEADRVLGGRARPLGTPPMAAPYPNVPIERPAVGEPRVRERIGGIERDGVFKHLDRRVEARLRALVPEVAPAQVQVVRREVLRAVARSRSRLSASGSASPRSRASGRPASRRCRSPCGRTCRTRAPNRRPCS